MATIDETPLLDHELDAHRRELTGFCYRMLGSGSEAEDAVQETLVRAWGAAGGLEARAALRSWLYRIATNVCLDMLKAAQRRARPMDLGPSSTADGELGPPLPETAWVLPIADDRVSHPQSDPAEVAATRETVRLAFVAALQHLPARQRAVLILRDVLHWRAHEVAELLDTTPASVNSALQRARATLDAVRPDGTERRPRLGADDETLLARYVDAFERYDVDAFVALLREDVEFCMPPFALWLRGPEQVGRWLLGQGIGCRGSRLLPARAMNGCPALGSYKPAEEGRWEPFSFMVLELDGGRVAAIHNFLGPEHFARAGLPPSLEDARVR